MGIPANALINNTAEIEKLIPHRDPMIMVDSLFSIDEENNSSVSGLTILPDNIFVRNKNFIEAGMIEHVAQSAAVRIGYILHNSGQSIPVGFICSLNKIKFHEFAHVNDKIRTTIHILQEVGNLSLIEFESFNDDMLLIEGQMKIILDL